MQTFTIRRFLGVRNSVESSDAPRGSMRKAEGILCAPAGSIVGGPRWGLGWSLSTLSAQITSALTGADATKVHFVTISHSTTNAAFLIAWDMAASRTVGAFYIGPINVDPSNPTGAFTPPVITVAAPSGSLFRNKAAGLRWFGSRINGELWLGNGTDANLVWRGGTMVQLGASVTGTSDDDAPARYAFPPCKQFIQTADGIVHAAGNVTYPLRVWSTEKPTVLNSALEGIYSTDTSFTSILHTTSTAITAIKADGTSVAVHVNGNAVIRLSNFEQDGGGYKMVQSPTKANSCAINPNCVADSLGAVSYYLGQDGELYKEQAVRGGGGYNQTDRRETYLATASSADLWNAGMADTTDTRHAHTQLLHDRGAGIVYLLAPLTVNASVFGNPAVGFGLWTYHEPNESGGVITGPIRYPNATDVVLCIAGKKAVAVAFTAGGSMLIANLSAISEPDTWEISAAGAALGADYATSSSAPTPTVGLPYVGITETVGSPAILHNVGGVQVGMANPWAEWSASSLPTPTLFFNNATVAILDIANEDFGSPNVIKEILSARLQFLRNTRAYVGVFAESGGVRYGRWRGLVYPKEEKLAGLKIVGRRLNLRIIMIYFNDQPLMLRDLSVDFEVAVAN